MRLYPHPNQRMMLYTHGKVFIFNTHKKYVISSKNTCATYQFSMQFSSHIEKWLGYRFHWKSAQPNISFTWLWHNLQFFFLPVNFLHSFISEIMYLPSKKVPTNLINRPANITPDGISIIFWCVRIWMDAIIGRHSAKLTDQIIW